MGELTQPPYQVMPEHTEEERAGLKADIEANGIQVPVLIDGQGRIIDGHTRVEIAGELGLEDYPLRVISGGLTDAQKRARARALNMQRRQLTQAQRREAIADQLRETPEASDRSIARELGVSHVTVGSVRSELAAGGQIDHLEERKGADGKTYTRPTRNTPANGDGRGAPAGDDPGPGESAGARPAQVPAAGEDPGAEASGESAAGDEPVVRGEREILACAKEIRKRQRAARRSERIERIAYRSEAPSLVEGLCRRYPVIVADPPWPRELEPDAQDYGGPSQHYPPMEVEEICALPVGEIAAGDAALFLWCCGTDLADGHPQQVARAWGFIPVSTIAWDKHPGSGLRGRKTGHWTFQDAEYLLVCKRGDMPPPPPDRRIPSPLRAPHPGKHSEKPAILYDLVAAAYPELRWLELFARAPRMGWARWGNEVGAVEPDQLEWETVSKLVKTWVRPDRVEGDVAAPPVLLPYAFGDLADLVDYEGRDLGELLKRARQVLEVSIEVTMEDLAHAEDLLGHELEEEKVFSQVVDGLAYFRRAAGELWEELRTASTPELGEEQGPPSEEIAKPLSFAEAPLLYRARFVRDSRDADRMERVGLGAPSALGPGVYFLDDSMRSRRCAVCLGLLTSQTEGDTHKGCEDLDSNLHPDCVLCGRPAPEHLSFANWGDQEKPRVHKRCVGEHWGWRPDNAYWDLLVCLLHWPEKTGYSPAREKTLRKHGLVVDGEVRPEGDCRLLPSPKVLEAMGVKRG